MTEHSITELQRQYEQSRDAEKKAVARHAAAKFMLTRALIQARGYLGNIVITKAIPRGVLVQDAQLTGLSEVHNFSGPAVKADGTIGSTNRIIYRHDKILEVREVQP